MQPFSNSVQAVLLAAIYNDERGIVRIGSAG
jgi:hypothetical protein